MNYEEAQKILAEMLNNNDAPETEEFQAVAKGLQAIDDCLEMGLNGDDF